MYIYRWEESLSVGVPEIDKQHKRLIEHLDELSAAVLKRQGKEKINKLLHFLERYTKVHFSSEENIMKEKSYPEIITHQKEHKKFVGTVDNFKRAASEEEDMEALAVSIQTVLAEWLIHHIKNVDKKLGDFLQAEKESG